MGVPENNMDRLAIKSMEVWKDFFESNERGQEYFERALGKVKEDYQAEWNQALVPAFELAKMESVTFPCKDLPKLEEIKCYLEKNVIALNIYKN